MDKWKPEVGRSDLINNINNVECKVKSTKQNKEKYHIMIKGTVYGDTEVLILYIQS